MSYLFLEYPKCSTCQKAKKWLDENNIEYVDRHIMEKNPSYDELKIWISQSGLPIKRFFNTSGLVYKEMDLKSKLNNMSDDEQIRLLSTDGRLIKRPLVIGDKNILVGFKPDAWECIK